MKNKYLPFHVLALLIPVIFCWGIPVFVKEYFDASTTYQPLPSFLIYSVSGVLLGILLVVLISKYLQGAGVWGILAGLALLVLMEINTYTFTVMYKGVTGNSQLIHLLLGAYLGILAYGVLRK